MLGISSYNGHKFFSQGAFKEEKPTFILKASKQKTGA